MKKFLFLFLVFILAAFPLFADHNIITKDILNQCVIIYGRNSLGSGCWVDPGGYIVTNKHVVAGIFYPKVVDREWNEYGARVVAQHSEIDIAVLKVELSSAIVPVEIGKVENMIPGDTVYAIGHPIGMAWTITKGIISKFVKTYDHERYIQHDAAVNPGSSGGPLFDEFGRVIGLNTLGTSMFGIDGMAFALDVRMLAEFVEKAIAEDLRRMRPLTEKDLEKPRYYRPHYRGYGF